MFGGNFSYVYIYCFRTWRLKKGEEEIIQRRLNKAPTSPIDDACKKPLNLNESVITHGTNY